MNDLNPVEALERKNHLLEKLKERVGDEKFPDYGIEQTESDGFPKYKIYLKNNPNYYFTYQEVVPWFHGEFYPPNQGSKVRKHQNQKGSKPEVAFNNTVQEMNHWLNAIEREKDAREKERILNEQMNPVQMFSEEEMQKPFTKKQKVIFQSGMNEMKFRTNLSSILPQHQKDLINAVIDISEGELIEIHGIDEPAAQGDEPNIETKQSFFDRMKRRLKAIMIGSRDLLAESIRDLTKDYLKDIIKYVIIGKLVLIPFSTQEKMEVYVITSTSFHFTINNAPLALPLAKEQIGELIPFTDADYYVESTLPMRKPNWIERLLGKHPIIFFA